MCFLTPDLTTAAFTGVLTVATIVYVIFTCLLWRETKKSADAAGKLAQSAKDSADAAIELNRPNLGIEEVQLLPTSSLGEGIKALVPGARQIIVTLKNYGSISAQGVMVDWKSYFQAENETRNNGRQGPIDVAQGASCPINLSVLIKPEDVQRMRGSAETYKVRIQAEYSAPYGKRRWRYTAVRDFKMSFAFAMDEQTPDRTLVVMQDS